VRRVLVLSFLLLLAPRIAAADPPPVLVALAPATDDDARKVVALGPTGEVYEPDGKGAWIRKRRISTADALQSAGRAGPSVVALGDGVVYKLADNGWSALRLAQHGKAILGSGAHAVAAVGKQLFAIDRPANGEPQKLALAPADITALGGGARGVVIAATARGLIKVEGAKITTLAWAPRTGIQRLVGDAWAITDRGALDLRTNKPVAIAIPAAAPVTIAGGDGALAFAAPVRSGGAELVVVHGPGKIDREPIAITPPVTAPIVGLAVDRAKRAVIALRDGRLAIRDERGTWTSITVSDQLPGEHPGSPPAASPR
jgi:hypothetical protein